ncbi:butyrate kinase [Deinococcus psychrotolerans]|uniref:Probable butyrate kinase n=1 Tax=Deinococcus psychrotolerans TaxID=2489213 RepID=A0A3G8YE80_9DEIO|nr:butyrate kinase [Deinococcus psychrotolerans]AZI43622.1 butyrate kinase [Deinococcus psychrotolerans]
MLAYVINPGSTSTKLALAEIERGDNPALPSLLRLKLDKTEVMHSALLSGPLELGDLQADLMTAATDWPKPDAVVAACGLIGNLQAGAYRVTPELAEWLLTHPHGEYTSNVGAALALHLAESRGVPAYVVDPPDVDELRPEARVSGLAGVERLSRLHTLNARLVARRAAHEQGLRFQDARVVVAHLGGSISVSAFEGAKIIDTTGARLDEGPFTPSRAGTLPIRALLDVAYSRPRSDAEKLLLSGAGFLGLTGTADLRELERREKTESRVKLAADAFAYQVAKNIGAYSAALSARPHAVAITGGIARWESVVNRIERQIGWIAPLTVLPGDLELEALAEGMGRVLLGLETAQDWTPPGAASAADSV